MASRGAAEVAFAIAAGRDDAEVIVLNVPLEPESALHVGAGGPFEERLLVAGWQMVEELAELGRSGGIRTRPEVRADARLEEVMLRAATSEGVDLIVLGTDVRAGSGRLFLGPRVERILATAPCPVMVINGV